MACTESGSAPPPTGQFAVVRVGGERMAIIVADRAPTDSEIDGIVQSSITSFPWVRLEVPTSTHGNAVVNVASDDVDLVFAQSYFDSCNPADAFSERKCWLVEQYRAGESGFRGTVSIRVDEQGLQGGYDVYWEGLTNRFDGPEQWHGHSSTGSFNLAAQNVRRVDL
jgi:hypothetical protein